MTRFRRFVSVVTMTLSVVVCAATTIAAILPAAALFADAQAKERAVRRALSDPRPNPSVLKAVRTVVAEYESVVRHYPGTPYCDDALWNAAQLSLEAYRKFGQGPDATAATRLFKRLSSEYPTSQWARQARNQSVPTATAASGRPRVPPQPSSPTIAPQGPVLAAVVASKSEPTKPESPKAEPTRAVAEETGTPRSVPVSASIEEPAPIVRASEPHPEPTPTLVSIRAVSPATITRIERSALPDIVRLTIWVSAEVTYREERLTGPPRLFFDFAGTRPSTTLMDRTLSFAGDGDIIREVRVGRHPPQITRVVLDTAGTSDCNVYPLYAPYRVVVDCVRAAGSGPSRLTPPPRAPIVTGTAAAGRSTWPAVPTEVAAAPLVPLVARRSALPLATLPGRPPLRAREAVPLSREELPAGRPSIDTAALRALQPEAPVPAAGAASAPPPTTAAGNLAGGFSIARQLGLSVSRIVIDPGHGGHDPGAKGPGITEAALVLDISLRLEQLLKQVPHTEVILTRRADVFVPLEERTALANKAGADLFLSVHANASATGQAGGVETYFLNFATSRQAAAVAARENAASGQSMNALPDFVKAIALNNKVDESRDFATQVQRALVQGLKPANQSLRDLGVKQAPFVVLIGAAMPSVLAEVAFVTNDQEAKLLRGAPYRQKIAEALAAAVQKYQASLGAGRLTQQ